MSVIGASFNRAFVLYTDPVQILEQALKVIEDGRPSITGRDIRAIKHHFGNAKTNHEGKREDESNKLSAEQISKIETAISTLTA